MAAGVAAIGAIHSTRAVGESNPPDQATIAQKVAPEVLADTAGGKRTSVVILLADQADVNGGFGMRD
jgi:hypothetical protein